MLSSRTELKLSDWNNLKNIFTVLQIQLENGTEQKHQVKWQIE